MGNKFDGLEFIFVSTGSVSTGNSRSGWNLGRTASPRIAIFILFGGGSR
jgi:hypothetical protein